MANKTESERPFDVLEKSKEKEVIVELKTGEVVVGKLIAFDIHLNMVLYNAKIAYEDEEEEIGKVFLRGDNILLVRDF